MLVSSAAHTIIVFTLLREKQSPIEHGPHVLERDGLRVTLKPWPVRGASAEEGSAPNEGVEPRAFQPALV